MLERLLEEIRAGGTFETGKLAARLGTTPALVEAMLDHLQQIGYLHPYYAEECGTNQTCFGCSLKGACKAAARTDNMRLWQG